MSLKQIADRLGYASVAYLSEQFRKVTGISIEDYRTLLHTNTNHQSLVQVLKEIHDKGYTHPFVLKRGGKLKINGKTRDLNQVHLHEVYRFHESPDSHGRNSVFTFEDQDGHKGYLVCKHH